VILEIIQTAGIVFVAIILVQKIKPPTKLKKTSDRTALLDSCALIDGRIVELAKAGFVPENLEVPEFIIAELQLLADGSDSQKRERARHGLEVVQILQQIPNIRLTINKTSVEARLTDDKLVELASTNQADLFTTDFNLSQVANIKGVRVLNVNELAHALRPVALPGEKLDIKVVQVGSSRDQGVGYLEDGTMIVIDNARKDVGRVITVKITRSHQTVAGRMVFAVKDATEQKTRPSTTKQLIDKKPTTPPDTQARRPKRGNKPVLGVTTTSPAPAGSQGLHSSPTVVPQKAERPVHNPRNRRPNNTALGNPNARAGSGMSKGEESLLAAIEQSNS
jgi:rRNA-processing protein FCF1